MKAKESKQASWETEWERIFLLHVNEDIPMDPLWVNSSAEFFLSMGQPSEDNATLERIDTFGGFFPNNCFWKEPLRISKQSIEYQSWKAMIDACYNPSCSRYHRYGGKGIKTVEEWKDFSSFYSDMGEAPAKAVLNRIDKKKGYSKENCEWKVKGSNFVLI